MTVNQLTASSSQLLKPLSTPSESQKPAATSVIPPAASTAQSETSSAVASENQIQRAVEQIKNATETVTQNLQFSIDKDTGITVIKIIDSQTDEIIRQFPTEEAVAIASKLDKMQGLLFDDIA